MARIHCLPERTGKQYYRPETIPEEHFAPFQMIGTLNTMEKHTLDGSPDIFDIFADLSKGAIQLFKELKSRLNYRNNLTFFVMEGLTRSQVVMFHKYVQELERYDIVVLAHTIDFTEPMPAHTYMFNPYLIKPKHYAKALEVWELLQKETADRVQGIYLARTAAEVIE